MLSSRRRIAGCILVFLIIATPTFAGGVDEEEEARAQLLLDLSLEDREYRVAVVSVVDDAGRSEESAIYGSYAQILRDSLLAVPRRYLPEEERRAIRADRLDRELAATRVELDERREVLERDAITAPNENPPQRRVDDEPLAAIATRLERLDGVSLEEIVLPPVLPLHVLDTEISFRRSAPALAATAETLDADLLFSIQVRDLGELRMITLQGYRRALDREEAFGRVIAAPEDLPQRFETELSEVLRAVSARDLARIAVVVRSTEGTLDEEARIRLDGRLIGIGTAQESFVEPGTYLITADRSDGRRIEQAVTLSGGERFSLNLTMPAVTTDAVTLLSRPAGAAVYEGALWRGFTPLALPRPLGQVEYRIVQNGFYDSRLSLTPTTPPVVESNLIGLETDWEARVESDRRRFYRAFGAFAVSLSGPILINGVFQNLGSLFPNGDARADLSASEADRLAQQSEALFYGYYASLALSSGLFGHMIWRLVQYVRTAGEYHRR